MCSRMTVGASVRHGITVDGRLSFTNDTLHFIFVVRCLL